MRPLSRGLIEKKAVTTQLGGQGQEGRQVTHTALGRGPAAGRPQGTDQGSAFPSTGRWKDEMSPNQLMTDRQKVA